MDLALTQEHQMIREQARELALLELSPRAAEVDSYYLFPWDGVKSLAEAGFLGMLVPPQLGGSGADLLSFCLVAEEVAKGCANTALVFVTHIAACQGLVMGGKAELKGAWLPPLARGEKLAAWAATEPDTGANVLATQTTARRDGDSYILRGTKIYITSADEAALYLLVVRTGGPGPQGLSLLALEKETPGMSFGRKFLRLGMNGTSSGEMFLADSPAPAGNLVGAEGGYLPLGFAMAGVGMVGAAAIALGLAQASLESAVLHAKQRVVAGQPLANFQGVQFAISEMGVGVEAARHLLYWAVDRLSQRAPGPPLPAYQAKLFATEMAARVTDKALQVHGGQGYTREYPIERYYRDVRGLTLHFGPSEVIKDFLGKAALGLLPTIEPSR